MNQSPEPDMAAAAAACEVSFDGRYYRFREYRYEQLADALRYARAQYAKAGFVPDRAFVPDWQAPPTLDAEQRALMARWGIGFASGRFTFGPYRYDLLPDAVAYARVHGARHEGEA